MKIGVKVMPRSEVLDSQGRAVERTLRQQKQDVAHCRVGKYVELEIEEADRDKALAKATSICESLLHNPLIETYELEVL
jgi:phosphoribosylformylglycinamidine synthase PurS subunit